MTPPVITSDPETGITEAVFGISELKELSLEIVPINFTGTVEFFFSPIGGTYTPAALSFIDSSEQASGVTFDASSSTLRMKWDVPFLVDSFRIKITNTGGSISISKWIDT